MKCLWFIQSLISRQWLQDGGKYLNRIWVSYRTLLFSHVMRSRVDHADLRRYANLLHYYIEKKAYLSGKLLHGKILRNGLFSEIFLCNNLIKLYCDCGYLHSARQVLDQMPAQNVFSWNGLLGGFSKAGLIEDALQLFYRMPERNVVSYNSVISALARGDFGIKSLGLYNRMIMEGLLPTHFTFASVLSACGGLLDLEQGEKCHGFVIKVGLDKNMYVENSLVGMYAKCRCLENALRAFDGVIHPNEVSFTSMIDGLGDAGCLDEAVRMFRRMLENRIQIDQVALSSILGVLSDNGECDFLFQGGECSASGYGQLLHALVVKLGYELDARVGNSLLDMYANCGHITDAESVFEMLPIITVISCNILIRGYGQNDHNDRAMKIFQNMHVLGFEPDEITYVCLFGALVKSEDFESARQVFDKMLKPSVISWNAILSGYCQEGNYEEVIKLFRKMQFENISFDRTTAALMLSSCASTGFLDLGRQMHAACAKAWLSNDVFVSSGLIDLYAKCGRVNAAKIVFDRMKERDVASWNTMIGGMAHHSLMLEAFMLYKQMQEEAIRPTQFSYASLVSSCAKVPSLFQGRQVHGQITKDGYSDDVFVGSSLIDMYSKCGTVEEAHKFFDNMLNKNVVSWNELINGYAQNGYGTKAIDLFEQMLETEMKPDSITFIAVLTACSHSGFVDLAIKYLHMMDKEYMIKPVAYHYTCVIDSLGRAGRFEEAEILIENMPCKNDAIIWEVLLSSCRVHANVGLAKQAAEQLFLLDPQNSTPYVLLFNIYTATGRWNDACEVRNLMIERGILKNPGYSLAESRKGLHYVMQGDDHNVVAEQAGKLCISGMV